MNKYNIYDTEHSQNDIEWIKHECAERHHELKYDSGYSEAHERDQSRYDGIRGKINFKSN